MASAETLSTSVREIEPILRQHGPESERSRRLARPIVEAMRKAGLYRMWRPKSFGGYELDPVSGFRVMEEVARVDSASGWNLQLSAAVDLLCPWFSNETASRIFAVPDAILGGAFNPPRKATPAKGGYRVTGRTGFVSGAHEDDWYVGLANIFDGEEPRLSADGAPTTILTICPASEAEIIDHWDTLGMCGTGSHDVALTDVFVPEERAVPWVPLEVPGSAYEGPLYRLTIWPAVAALAPPALGIARAALEEMTDLATAKIPAYTAKTLRDRSVVQSQIARAEAHVRSARAFLYDVFDEAYDDAVAGRRPTMKTKAMLQLASTNAVLASADAVDLVHAAVGASGIRREYAFQKHFRDIHVITQHAFICASRYESVGQILMGLEPEWPFFSF